MKKFALICALIFAFLLGLCACSEAYKLSFSQAEYSVQPGVSFTVGVNVKPKNMEYTITSANNTIATVTDNVITAVKEGVVKLTVKSGNLQDECTLYVSEEAEQTPDLVLKTVYTVSFEIVNYEEAGLSTGTLEGVYAVEGSFLNVSDPVISGYITDCWYTDSACTQKFDMQERIYSSFTLYARLEARETAYNVVNGYVTGLLYPNLPHEELILPEAEANGGVIYGIADGAFSGDDTIVRVVIPASYRTIGTSAFAGCTALEEVVLPADSELRLIGDNAFGVLRDSGGNIDEATACSKLTFSDGAGGLGNLPDSVTRVGSFAFYGCASLVLDGIPDGLTYLEQYSFSGTLINHVSLKNVSTLYEGVFYGCSALDTVTDTEGVLKCAKLVFSGSKVESDGRAKYNSSRADDDAAYYAGTILFGCYTTFGRLVGSGKLHIKEDTTLIADEAFANSAQSELTLYIDTETANAAVANRNFLGENVFVASSGVFVAVGEGLSAAYRSRYSEGNGDYAALFVETLTVEVSGNYDTVNWGKHVLLKSTYYTVPQYYYDKYVPYDEGTPRQIKLSNLIADNNLLYNIVRVNMSAFTNISALTTLELDKVQSIAYLAVSNCSALTRIDLTKTTVPASLEDKLSIQTSSVSSNMKIYVKAGDLSAYKSYWSSFSLAAFLVGE